MSAAVELKMQRWYRHRTLCALYRTTLLHNCIAW